MKTNKKILIGIGVLAIIVFLLAWAPWITNECAINKVVEKLGGPDAQFFYLTETMVVRDIPKEVNWFPFSRFVTFPGEAGWFVSFYNCIFFEELTQNQVIDIAKEHLQKYVYHAFPNKDFFSMVEKVEVVDGECEANKYWENWDKPPIKSPKKHQCWIVKFYYPGPAEGSHLVVYVNKNTNEVLGGTQTR